MISGDGIREALEGCRVAYYLVHSMEAADDADFAARDRTAARNFADAATAAGVERVVYLGGLAPGRPARLPPHRLARGGRGDPAGARRPRPPRCARRS